MKGRLQGIGSFPVSPSFNSWPINHFSIVNASIESDKPDVSCELRSSLKGCENEEDVEWFRFSRNLQPDTLNEDTSNGLRHACKFLEVWGSAVIRPRRDDGHGLHHVRQGPVVLKNCTLLADSCPVVEVRRNCGDIDSCQRHDQLAPLFERFTGKLEYVPEEARDAASREIHTVKADCPEGIDHHAVRVQAGDEGLSRTPSERAEDGSREPLLENETATLSQSAVPRRSFGDIKDLEALACSAYPSLRLRTSAEGYSQLAAPTLLRMPCNADENDTEVSSDFDELKAGWHQTPSSRPPAVSSIENLLQLLRKGILEVAAMMVGLKILHLCYGLHAKSSDCALQKTWPVGFSNSLCSWQKACKHGYHHKASTRFSTKSEGLYRHEAWQHSHARGAPIIQSRIIAACALYRVSFLNALSSGGGDRRGQKVALLGPD